MDPVTIFGVVQTLRRASGKKGLLGMLGIKNLLALVGLVVVAFVAAGWYLGWYSIGTQDDSQGHHQVKIQVNSSQVVEDLNKGKEKVILMLDKSKGTVTQTTAEQTQQGPVQAHSIPLVPRATAEVHAPQTAAPMPPQLLQTPVPVPPPAVDSWVFPPR